MEEIILMPDEKISDYVKSIFLRKKVRIDRTVPMHPKLTMALNENTARKKCL